jgi:hypothetical protein
MAMYGGRGKYILAEHFRTVREKLDKFPQGLGESFEGVAIPHLAKPARCGAPRQLSLAILPETVEAPGGDRAAVLDGAVEQHPLKLGNRRRPQDEIVLLGVGIDAGWG